MVSNTSLTPNLLVSSALNLCRLDQDQDQLFVSKSDGNPERYFLKKLILKKKSANDKNS